MKKLFFLFSVTLVAHSFSLERRTNQLEFKRAGSFTEESQNKRRLIERKQGDLHRAARDGDIKRIIQLLYPQKGSPANPNRPDEYGMTAAHYAVKAGNPAILRTLQTDPRTNFSQQDDKKQTPLHLACSLGYQKCTKILLSYDVQLNLLNNSNHTPLEVAELAGRIECRRLIQEHKAQNDCSRSEHRARAEQLHSEESARSAAAAVLPEENNECPLCMEPLSDNSNFLFTCSHGLHTQCSENIIQHGYTECLLCKEPLKNSLSPDQLALAQEKEKKRQQEIDEEASNQAVLEFMAAEYAAIL
ncbi:ankyrin repeat domain-containing protein [Candidatus Babeliales bacterium]|nr:ankyrin repeat domain-containing protein [Candidatus Babeliales bacterium]